MTALRGGTGMEAEYDFSQGKRGAIDLKLPAKTLLISVYNSGCSIPSG
ncbi:hypothetical protein [Tychonema sp. LEGE 07203]|nr:hypothetical protein [Tychonema sp. LEGE 07203]